MDHDSMFNFSVSLSMHGLMTKQCVICNTKILVISLTKSYKYLIVRITWVLVGDGEVHYNISTETYCDSERYSTERY